MSTQLRLVETPKAPVKRRAKKPAHASVRIARAPKGASRRAAHWGDWELDARTRRVGRAGVAAAREALETVRSESGRSEHLAQAS